VTRADAAPATSLKDFVNKDGSRWVTYKRLDLCINIIYGALNKVLDTERDRIDVLEAKAATLVEKVAAQDQEIAELKAGAAALSATALKGGSTWARGVAYILNDTAQYDGSLWRCVEPHVSGETFAHDRFVLQVKHGRDGKDLR